jgi:hypothetical protein
MGDMADVAIEDGLMQDLMEEPLSDWEADCLQHWGQILTGAYAHWCSERDDLPIDESCDEWPCGCGYDVDDMIYGDWDDIRAVD